MTLLDRLLELWITVILIYGGYSHYFWAQRQRWYPARFIGTRLDDRIGYDARWVWIYSALYYPMILLAALSIPTWQEYAYAVGCFLALLAAQMVFFLFLPVEIPPEWRTVNRAAWVRQHGRSYSQDFLDAVWSYDKLRNSMPSMHVSVAVMVDLTIWRNWPMVGHVGILFPILIAISAIKTKQHYLWDIPAGAALGAAVFFAWHALVP